MMTEHFESWYATLDTSLRNMVEGGLVATACGWAGATVCVLLAAAAWVRGRMRASRVSRATEAALTKYAAQGSAFGPPPVEPEPAPVVKEPTLVERLLDHIRHGEAVPKNCGDSVGFRFGPLWVHQGRPDGYLHVLYQVNGLWVPVSHVLPCDESRKVDKAAQKAIQDGRSRALEAACQPPKESLPADPAAERRFLVDLTQPEPKPEPCPPPLSPLASVLLELFACGSVSPNDDGRGFKVGALSVGFGIGERVRLTYPVAGAPTDLTRLLDGDEADRVDLGAREAWKRYHDAATEKARERAVAALKAQVAVFRGEQAKQPRMFTDEFLARVRDTARRMEEVMARAEERANNAAV
jgi:hypothetical protein